MAEYEFSIPATDLSVALDCEADRAAREGFKLVESRQRAAALHLRNAIHAMQKICPEGFVVDTKIVVSHVVQVNPVLKDEYREP